MMIMFQALEDSNILLKRVTNTIKNVTKRPKGGFLSKLLGTLEVSLRHLLSGKGVAIAGHGNKEGKGIVRAGYGNKTDFQCRLIL